MPKPIFQDIVPPEKKSIKKIPIPERNNRPKPLGQQVKRTSLPAEHHNYDDTEEETPVRTTSVQRAPKPRGKSAMLALGIIAILAISGGIIAFFPGASGASITVVPKGEAVTLDAEFSATSDTGGSFSYQTATYSKEGRLAVPSNGEEYAQIKANGTIRIFNNYNSAPQTLVGNTRFETADGKIFRISQQVIVPGKNGNTPGSIDASVTADKAGPDYNVGLADLSIPGFKGDPRYGKIFARSASPIEGGFSGMRKKVDEASVKAAREKIREELEATLIKQMIQNTPENFIFLPKAYFIEYSPLADAPAEDGVQIGEKAVFHGIMFKRTDLAVAISVKTPEDDGGKNDIAGTENLIFSPKASISTTPWEDSTLVFRLNGTATLISAIDPEKLKEELAGKPRNGASQILSGHPEISKAEVVMKPFWMRSFPEDISSISVTITPIKFSP